VGNHLSGEYVAISLKPPVKAQADEQPIAFVGVASDRVYRTHMSPYKPVSSYLAFPPLPALKRAVYLCCTLPEVTLGGRYPLSCSAMLGLSSMRKECARRLPDLLVTRVFYHLKPENANLFYFS